MSIKHLQFVTSWTAAVLTAVLFFLSENTLFGDSPIRALLAITSLAVLVFAVVSSWFLVKEQKVSFFNLFRVIGLLGGLTGMVIVFYAALNVGGYWSEEVNGIFFVGAGVAFVFTAYNYIAFSSQSIQNKRYSQKPELTDWILTLVLPLLIGVYGIFSLYNQETSISSVGQSDFAVQPATLMGEFEKDATSANQKYIGKIIRFSGSVAEIGGDSSILISLNAWKEGYAVNCNFDIALKEKLSAVLQGDSVLLQCSCSGLSAPEEGMSLLSEISLEMTRCALIETYKNTPNLGTDVEKPKEAPRKKRK